MRKAPFVIALAMTGSILLAANNNVVGVAVSSGNVTVNNTLVPGNATIFDGNTIETGATTSRLQLKNGKLVQLGTDSRGTFYGNRMILEKGFSETSGSYEVDANTLKIEGDSARVAIYGKTVQVAALSTPVSVSTSTGIRVANLLPGRALAFTPQESGALPPATLVGWVRKVGDSYVLTDTTSNVTVQLVGGGIEAHKGHFVKITGTPAAGSSPVSGASQVLNVTNVEMQPKPGKGSTGAAGLGGGGGPASKSAIVVGGIAILAGIGVTAGVLATQGENSQPISLSPTPQ